MEYLITRGNLKEKMDSMKLNIMIGTKITPAFQHMIDNLKMNEELYHYDTKIKIKRLK
jgi:hypothetical protein